MAVTAPQPAAGTGAGPGPGPESHIDSTWVDAALGKRGRPRLRLPADRVRKLLLLGLLGAAAVALWLRLLASAPHLPLVLQVDALGRTVLVASSDATLHAGIGRTVQALLMADGQRVAATPALLPRSLRWTVDDAERAQQRSLRTLVDQAVQQSKVTVLFDSGLQVAVAPLPRGLSGLGGLCWAVCALALALYLSAVVALQAKPARSAPAAALFLVLALAQSLNLLMIGAGALPGLGLPGGLSQIDFAGRLGADLVTAAALLHVLALYPQRLRWAHAVGGLAWAVAAASLAWLLGSAPAGLWWWAQALMLGTGMVSALLLQQGSGHPHPHPHPHPNPNPTPNPLARLMQRLVLAGTGTLALLTAAMALAGLEGEAPHNLATLGSAAWYGFFASLLMLGPFLSRSRRVLREFTLLAGVSTVATSLTLLFLAIFGLHPLAATALALVVSVGVYALARPWFLGQLATPAAPSTERLFDSLYRAARALEQSPSQAVQPMAALLREVFDPLELARSQRPVSRVRVAADGATLVVPVPQTGPGQPEVAIVLRHAQRGQRLFTAADRQLCERLLEQLQRAVAHDRAVEQGRTEERTRIAQDLHDDIGARLLTLMYKAPNAEIEGYIRHTLQDLKTLTRGLAASNQRLSHAAAEWKADISQRLNATGCRLHWNFSSDRDPMLSAVQWSGLTRVLRELVNNIITHAQAGQVEITLQLDHGQLLLTVSDDGLGRAPETWSHGLGLGGVRKRVKLLGGQVQWLERDDCGIRCEVRAALGRTAH